MKKKNDLSFSGILIVGMIVSALISVVVFGISRVASKFSPDVANAERLLRDGKLEEAAVIAEKLNDHTTAREILRGKVYLAMALQRQKDEGWGSYGTDSANWLKGADADSALACFERAFHTDPASAKALFFIGVVCKERGWFNRAEDAFLNAAALEPGEITTLLALGSLYALKGEYREAELHLKRAFELSPENPEPAKNLAFLYRFHINSPESAAVYLAAYLRVRKPGDIDAQRAITELEELRRRYPEITIPPQEPAGQTHQRVFIPRK